MIYAAKWVAAKYELANETARKNYVPVKYISLISLKNASFRL
jgi:hypothetical protein